MESIFENTTTLTRQNLTEMARATVPRWSLLVGIIPAVLAVAAAIWDLARRGISLWAGLLLLAAFALVMTTYGAPARVALKIAKRNFKEYGSEVTATLCFYEDKVIVHNHQEDSEGDLRYEQILAVRQSPRLYLLELPGKTALLLEKTAFTKGALEEFPAFMRRKCPGRSPFKESPQKRLTSGEKACYTIPRKKCDLKFRSISSNRNKSYGRSLLQVQKITLFIISFTGGQ